MINSYIDIPINFKVVTQKQEIPKISIKQSIHNMIHLISTTSFGELKHDRDFGCEIWMHDFNNIYNTHSFKEDLRKSIVRSIEKNEKRIKNIKIDLNIEQTEIKIKGRRAKVRVNLIVTGTIEKTNEQLTHHEKFFIGPLSYY